MTDLAGGFVYVNRAWHDATGYPDDDLRRMCLADLVPEISVPGWPPRTPACSRARRSAIGSDLPHAGRRLAVEGSASSVMKDGLPVMVRGIWRDVTERKRVDEQLRRAERMQAAGQLAGGVAHEVNNMMTGVIGFGSFLLRSLDTGDPAGPTSRRS